MTAHLDQLIGTALAWLANDPDPATREELRAVIEALPDSEEDLADRFSGPLRFGTAGLRGPLRAGWNGMNLAVVRNTAAGLVAWLSEKDVRGPVVIGYDARHGSRAFAEMTASVVTGAGRKALLLPRPLPTPVLAAAVRASDAAIGVMVTASHNPPRDNGYKVYLGHALGGAIGAGAQLVSPADAEIEAAIRTVCDIPLGPVPSPVAEDVVDAYIDAAAAVVAAGPRSLTVAYTPLHGVGCQTFTSVMTRAGFSEPIVVADQAAPDPDFPTVTFPNPEEPGVMDRLLALASAKHADVAIANDPDADRCAVAVPERPGEPSRERPGEPSRERPGEPSRERPGEPSRERPGEHWKVLHGDELGILLADHLMRRGVRGRYAATIVSSTMLSRLCAARGMPYGETLTGFKWIMRAGEDLVFGYEEALGYSVMPSLVRDKDGITAGLLVCELAAMLASRGMSLLDRLDELAGEFGVHATDQLSVRVNDLCQISDAMATIRALPPTHLLGRPVTAVRDLSPEADVLSVHTDAARVVVRPSGTEPKLKAYLEIVEPVTEGDVAAARLAAAAGLVTLRAETAAALGLSRPDGCAP